VYIFDFQTGVCKMNSKIWALARIALGLIFLWAFLDKAFGLGFATKSTSAWIDGGSPTTGFLSHATGPLATYFQSLAGSPIIDWLFMLSLLGLGIALIIGVCMNLAGWGGSVLLILMWAASLPVENHPFIDQHIIYALVLIGLASGNIGNEWSLRTWWKSTGLVTRHPFLG